MSEIGIFLKAVSTFNRRKYTEHLSQVWMGSNLTKDSYIKTLNELSKDPIQVAKQSKDPKFISSEWDRLKKTFSGAR